MEHPRNGKPPTVSYHPMAQSAWQAGATCLAVARVQNQDDSGGCARSKRKRETQETRMGYAGGLGSGKGWLKFLFLVGPELLREVLIATKPILVVTQ